MKAPSWLSGSRRGPGNLSPNLSYNLWFTPLVGDKKVVLAAGCSCFPRLFFSCFSWFNRLFWLLALVAPSWLSSLPPAERNAVGRSCETRLLAAPAAMAVCLGLLSVFIRVPSWFKAQG